MTDKTKPHTTVAQDVAALRAVVDGQHATPETPAEVLAEMRATNAALESEIYDWADRLSRSLAAGKVVYQVRCHDPENSEAWFDVSEYAHGYQVERGRETRILYTAPPADPAKASEPEYNRSLIADMLEDCHMRGHVIHEDAVEEQIRLLRAADNADAAKVRTVRASGSAPDDRAEWSLHDRVEFALRDAGFDYDLAFDIASKAATPPASAPEVTEDVLDRAVDAYDEHAERHEGYTCLRECMRAALIAALQQQGGKSHG